MKPTIFLGSFLAILAFAQSENEHGVRTGPTQTAYLIKPIDLPFTVDVSDFANLAKVSQAEQEARARAGSAPVRLILTGKSALTGKETHTESILRPLDPCPRAVFETWAEQLGRQWGEGVLTGFEGINYAANRTEIHRFVRDNFRHVYVAYTVTIESLPDNGSYRVVLASGGSSPEDVSQDWKIVAPPRLPMPQIASDGDAIPVLLYEDANTHQRLLDYIHVVYFRQLTLRNDAARDAYSDDAEFSLVQPRLRVSGVVAQPGSLHESHGQKLLIDIPGQGTFILSFKPLAGFELAGEVSGKSLTFAWKDDLFQIDCSERIASAGSASYHVYVRH